jgi:hypothetical protein
LAFHAIRIRHAAIYGADGGALRFFVESDALGAFIRDNVVIVIRNGTIFGFGVHLVAILQGINTFNCAAV